MKKKDEVKEAYECGRLEGRLEMRSELKAFYEKKLKNTIALQRLRYRKEISSLRKKRSKSRDRKMAKLVSHIDTMQKERDAYVKTIYGFEATRNAVLKASKVEITTEMDAPKKPFAELPDPTKADFILHCCGEETHYDSSVEHLLSHEGGFLECRICGAKYVPFIAIALRKEDKK